MNYIQKKNLMALMVEEGVRSNNIYQFDEDVYDGYRYFVENDILEGRAYLRRYDPLNRTSERTHKIRMDTFLDIRERNFLIRTKNIRGLSSFYKEYYMYNKNIEKMDVVKVRFLDERRLVATGREYTYVFNSAKAPMGRLPEVGEIVEAETTRGVSKAQVTQINVPWSEIEQWVVAGTAREVRLLEEDYFDV